MARPRRTLVSAHQRHQAKRLKALEHENTRLRKLVADQALDNAILKEVASGNF